MIEKPLACDITYEFSPNAITTCQKSKLAIFKSFSINITERGILFQILSADKRLSHNVIFMFVVPLAPFSIFVTKVGHVSSVFCISAAMFEYYSVVLERAAGEIPLDNSSLETPFIIT